MLVFGHLDKKRAAFALGFLIVWQMIEGISFGLMKWKLSNIIPSLSAEQVFAFFPLNAMSNLIKEPFTRLSGVQNIANQVGESIDKDYGLDWGSAINRAALGRNFPCPHLSFTTKARPVGTALALKK